MKVKKAKNQEAQAEELDTLLSAPDITSGEVKYFSKEDGTLPPQEYRSLAEKVAQHRIYQRGVWIKELQAAFPTQKWLWRVSRFFPYSPHGKLFIDEPSLPIQIEESKKKKEILDRLGFKTVILYSGVSFEDAMEQLSFYKN